MDEVTHGRTPATDGAEAADPVVDGVDGTAEVALGADGTAEIGTGADGTAEVRAWVDHTTMPLPVGAPTAEPTPPSVRYAAGAAPVAPPASTSGHSWLSPTLNIERPHNERAVDYPAPVPVGPARRSRWWIAAAVAILLIVGGIIAFTQSRSSQSSPTGAVLDFFGALDTGDAASALTLVDGADKYPASANPLLSDAALARVADRPTDLAITGAVATNAEAGRKTTVVSVTYTVGGYTVHQAIDVLDRDAHAPAATKPYLLKAPFITVSVPTSDGRVVSVNGVPVPSGTTHALAFPATYTATVAGNQLLAAGTSSAVYNSTPDAVEADIASPAPAVAPGATAAVQAAVNSALDKCAASKSATPANCPFSYSDSGATVNWKIVTYPKVNVIIDSGVVAFVDDGHPGSVHYDATTSFLFGLIPHTDSGSENAEVTGTATVSASAVTVTFTRQ